MTAVLKNIILALAAGLVLFAACLAQAQEQEQKIAVLVNDTPISAFDIDQRTRFLAVTSRQKPSPALRKKATEELISEAIQLQEAKKHGLIVEQSEIDRAVKNIATRNKLTPEKLAAGLGRLGVNMRTLRQKFEAQIAWSRVVRGKFRNQVAVGDAQVDKALSERKQDDGEQTGKEKTEFQLQRVRLELPENPNQRTIAKRLVEADELRERIKTCDQIQEVIRRYSGASVKSIGRKTSDAVAQPSRALLSVAKTGHLTPAYITASGVELYAVCGRRSVSADNSQREKVQRQLIGQEFEILALRHLRDLRQEAFVEFR